MASQRVWVEGGNVDTVGAPMQYIGQGEQRIWIEGGNLFVSGGGGGGDLKNAGAWSNATAYAVNDVVTHNNSSYVCLVANTNQTPPMNNAGTHTTLMEWTPFVPVNPDAGNVEAGVAFTVDEPCTLTAINWYRGDSTNTGPWNVRLWNRDSGALIYTEAHGAATASGWQTKVLTTPQNLVPNVHYSVSYSVPGGHYSSTLQFFIGGNFRFGPVRIEAGVFNTTIGNNPVSTFNNTWYSMCPTVTTAGSTYWLQLSKGIVP